MDILPQWLALLVRTSLIVGLCFLGTSCKNPLGDQDQRDTAFAPGGGGSAGGSNQDVDTEAPDSPTSLSLSSRWVTGSNPASSPIFTWTNPIDDFASAEVALGLRLGGEELVPFQESQGTSSHTFTSLGLAECSITYYPSVKALDTAGNESTVVSETLGFRYDNSAPTSVGSVTIPGFDGNTTQTVTVDWSALPSTDNCGVDHYEIALSYDDESDGFDAGDVGNLINWSDVPGGSATTSYQIQDGVDGFSFSSTFEREYYISIRAIDEAGLSSAPTHSAGWYTFYPTQIAGLEVWLDGRDRSSQFQDVGCSTTPVVNNGDPVACWRDKSNQGNHATQNVGADQPTAGFSGVDFDGNDHVLTVPTKNYVTASDLTILLQFETDIQSNDGGSCCRPVLSFATASTGLYAWLGLTRGNLAPNNNLFHGWDGTGLNYMPTVPGDTFIISATHDGSNALWNVWTLGQQQVVNYAISNFTGTPLSIGGDVNNTARRFHGEIYEVMIVESILGTMDRQNLEGYMACKYDTRNTLDPSHPYYDLVGANKAGCP
jgi:hypothetical protein